MGLQNCYSADVIAGALRGFQARFENILPSSAIVGRWAKDQFAAILSTAPGNAIEMSSEVVRKLSEPFLERKKAERIPSSSIRAPASSNSAPARISPSFKSGSNSWPTRSLLKAC